MNATTDEIEVPEQAITDAMRAYGGSFARALAVAFDYADASNFERLRGAFPELWMRYRQMAQQGRVQP